MTNIILASSSPYRKELLKRLKIKFSVVSSNINEKKLNNENAATSAKRLSKAKAEYIAQQYQQSYIIGCDQTAEYSGIQIEKPLNFNSACKQLALLSNKKVNFYSAICLINKSKNIIYEDVIKFNVRYKNLTTEQIKSYLKNETPYNCVGSIKSEGLGISLLAEINSNDPTAIIGLPLITLTKMLIKEGVM